MYKKSQKWKCKVCNATQTLSRLYFESNNAKECRVQVQCMNKEYMQPKVDSVIYDSYSFNSDASKENTQFLQDIQATTDQDVLDMLQ